MHCNVSPAQVADFFFAAAPAISRQVYNKTIRIPRWLSDVWELEEAPLGAGNTIQQLNTRGNMPKIERGFERWKKLSDNTGCNPCPGDDCGYNWTTFGGTGIESKLIQMMSRDFRSATYCVKEIETTAHWDQVFAQIVQNLYAQITFFKEYNIGFNYLTGLAKKLVVDSSGFVPNKQNPYNYVPLGTARLSTLNIDALEFLYEYMKMMTSDAIPYDVVNGSPLFAMECSQQLFSRMYRDDPQLRQDARFSGYSNDLLTKYNFQSTARGMFIFAPIQTPRRFRYDTGLADWVEILPYDYDIPMEVGSFTGLNPRYIDPGYATHEEVLLHGKNPFKVMFRNTLGSLGEGTSFGPEYSFMNAWDWVNPQTVEDPARREGFFFTSATIGLAPQNSEAIFGTLWERAKGGLAFSVGVDPVCPTTPGACTNLVPAVGCPCPLVTSYTPDVVVGDYILTFGTPLPSSATVSSTVNLGIDTGGYLVGTIVSINAARTAAHFTFPNGTVLPNCDQFTTLFCDNTLGCSSGVAAYLPLATNTDVDVIVYTPLKALSGTVTVYYGNGTNVSATVQAVNMETSTWTLRFGGAFSDNVSGIIRVCVPTATDATCPACSTSATFTQCT